MRRLHYVLYACILDSHSPGLDLLGEGLTPLWFLHPPPQVFIDPHWFSQKYIADLPLWFYHKSNSALHHEQFNRVVLVSDGVNCVIQGCSSVEHPDRCSSGCQPHGGTEHDVIPPHSQQFSSNGSNLSLNGSTRFLAFWSVTGTQIREN